LLEDLQHFIIMKFLNTRNLNCMAWKSSPHTLNIQHCWVVPARSPPPNQVPEPTIQLDSSRPDKRIVRWLGPDCSCKWGQSADCSVRL